MSILLFVITVALTAFSVISSVIFLWINNFSSRLDAESRNKGIKHMMRITMIAAMVSALLTGLLSDSGTVEAAISSTVTLYFIIAISMLSVILLSAAVLIYRFISSRHYSSGTSSGISQIITVSAIGAAVSLVLAWLLS